MSDQSTLSDDELARDDPDLCEYGWSHLHPQSCPECEDESSSAKTTVRYVNAPTDVVRRMTDREAWLFEQGFAAYADGIPRDHVPAYEIIDERRWWLKGWYASRNARKSQ